jgi:putative hydrolase
VSGVDEPEDPDRAGNGPTGDPTFGGGASDDDPLASLGEALGDFGRLFLGGLGATGGSQWGTAAQIAAGIATEGRSEANIDPGARMAVEQLSRVAELHVQQASGIDLPQPLRVEPLNRTQWSRRFLDDERPLLEGIAGSLGQGLAAQLQGMDDDDLGTVGGAIPGFGTLPPAMMQQLLDMMGPMMLAMMAGSTAGHLAARALGHYELPLPRPVDAPLSMVLSNVDEFAAAWSLPADDIRLWVCLSDAAHHTVLGIPHVRGHLESLVLEYTRSFSTDPEQIERQALDLGVPDVLGSDMADIEALQRLAGEPDLLLGAMQSRRQRELVPQITAIVAAIEGWVDHVLDATGGRLLGDDRRVTEALRRRRVEAGPQTRFIERLLGLELSQATFDRGGAFVAGVLARTDAAALRHLWDAPGHLPTPAEIDAPGLWLARVGIEGRELDPGDIDIPDAPDF